MPTVKNIHIALNLDTADGREIGEGLARLPAGQQSAFVRQAILAYLRGQGGASSRRAKATKPPPEQRRAAASLATGGEPSPAAGIMAVEQPQDNSELAQKTKGLFDLLQ